MKRTNYELQVEKEDGDWVFSEDISLIMKTMLVVSSTIFEWIKKLLSNYTIMNDWDILSISINE